MVTGKIFQIEFKSAATYEKLAFSSAFLPSIPVMRFSWLHTICTLPIFRELAALLNSSVPSSIWIPVYFLISIVAGARQHLEWGTLPNGDIMCDYN